jgi:hypothetical protein
VIAVARRVFIAERLESRLLLAADLGLGLEPDAHILPVPGFVDTPPAAIGAPTGLTAPVSLGGSLLSGPAAPVSTGGNAGPARPSELPVVDEFAAAILFGCGHEGLGGAPATNGIDAFSASPIGSTSHGSEHSSAIGGTQIGGNAATVQLLQDGVMPMAAMNMGLSIGHLAGGEVMSAADANAMPGDGMLKDGETMYAGLGMRSSESRTSDAAIVGADATNEALGAPSDDAMSDMAGDLAAMNSASKHAMASDDADEAMAGNMDSHDEHASVDSLLAGWASGEAIDSAPMFDANHAAIAARTAAELPTLIASKASSAAADLAIAAKVDVRQNRDAGATTDRAEIRLASASAAARPRAEQSRGGFDAISAAAAIAAIGAIGGALLCELHLRRQRRLAEVEALVALSRRAA